MTTERERESAEPNNTTNVVMSTEIVSPPPDQSTTTHMYDVICTQQSVLDMSSTHIR